MNSSGSPSFSPILEVLITNARAANFATLRSMKASVLSNGGEKINQRNQMRGALQLSFLSKFISLSYHWSAKGVAKDLINSVMEGFQQSVKQYELLHIRTIDLDISAMNRLS